MTENNTVYETATTFAPSATSQSKTMRYYDLKKNWRRVKPHLVDKKLNDILVRDFNKFTTGRWGRPFVRGDLPSDFESCDWDIDHRGKRPAFWQYVKHAACHWLVNFSLRLAMLVEPEKPWRIITSEGHSTVWDGGDTLFDFNFQAFGIDPNRCFETAFEKELKLGKYLRVYLAESMDHDLEFRKRELEIRRHVQEEPSSSHKGKRKHTDCGNQHTQTIRQR